MDYSLKQPTDPFQVHCINVSRVVDFKDSIASAFGAWKKMFADQSESLRLEYEKDDFDINKLGDPKIGKFDPDNTPHVGGSTWAGGTGGYNTAGLGGVGGPFRSCFRVALILSPFHGIKTNLTLPFAA